MKSLKFLYQRLPLNIFIGLTILKITRKVFGLVGFKFRFSQAGEDDILPFLLENTERGFYIEVGCNEPININNTFNLYLRGWSGLLIDANKDLISKNKKVRPKDKVICAAISNVENIELVFQKSEDSEISTLSQDLYNRDQWRYNSSEVVKTVSLETIFKNNIPLGQTINLLSIDIEEHDYEALTSFDIYKYRPKVIVIEMHNFNFLQPNDSEIYKYLIEKKYKFVSYSILNGYFIDTLN